MKSLIYTFLLALVIVSASAFFFVSPCSAASTIEENFTYPDGHINQSIFDNGPDPTYFEIISNQAEATSTAADMIYNLVGTSTTAQLRFDFTYSLASSSGGGICFDIRDSDDSSIFAICHSVKQAGNDPVLWRDNGTIIRTGFPTPPVYSQLSMTLQQDTEVITISGSNFTTFSTSTNSIDYAKDFVVYAVNNGTFSNSYFDDFKYYYDYLEPSIYVVDSPRDYSEAKIYPPSLVLCSINYPCNITFQYTPLALGLDVNLSLDYTGLPGNSLATTTITNAGGIAHDTISLPIQTSFQTLDYDLFLNLNGATGTAVYEDIPVIWAASSSLPVDCDEVETSGGGFDDLRYGVECGGVKLMKWAFDPTIDHYVQFLVAMDTLQNSFPFSIIYDLEDMFQAFEDATGTTMILPFMWIDGEPLHNDETDEDVNFLNPGMFQDDVFSDIWNNYIYRFMEVMLYLFFVIYFIKRLMSLTRNKETIEQ